jgi:hypothetical protein
LVEPWGVCRGEEAIVTVDVLQDFDGDRRIELRLIEGQPAVAGDGTKLHPWNVELIWNDDASTHQRTSYVESL